MTAPNLRPVVRELLDEVVRLRHDLHAHPELAYQEHRTAGIVAERLRALGLEPRTGLAETGVTAVIDGAAGDGPTILLRADMDALPIHEENDLPYRSRHDGKMHACGHDGHTAILLGCAEALVRGRERLRGRVKLCFQPAEEQGGGARPMIEAGALEDPPVDYAFGLHLWAPEPTGTVGVRSGPVMASTDGITITIRGRGGHAAHPDGAIDTVLIGSHLVSIAQSLVSRNVSPLESAVVSITQFHAGEAFNVIPETAVLGGTVRTFDPAVRERIKARLTALCEQVPAAFGATAELDYRGGYPSTVNHEAESELVHEAIVDVVGEDGFFVPEPTMGGEDFAYFLEQVPGAFFMVGIQNEEKGTGAAHHNPRFNVDDDALGIGIETFLRIVERVTGSA